MSTVTGDPDMSADIAAAEPTPAVHADLAYLKALVEGDGRVMWAFGVLYMVGGLVFGAQALVQWAVYAKLVDLGPWGGLAVVLLPILIITAACVWLAVRERKARADVASKAIAAAFQGVGCVTLAIFALFIVVVLGIQGKEELRPATGVLWLLYGAVVFAIQGGAWHLAWALRRRLWMLAVALGFLASTLALAAAAATFNIHLYIGIAVFDLFVLIALPGAVVVHLSRKEARA